MARNGCDSQPRLFPIFMPPTARADRRERQQECAQAPPRAVRGTVSAEAAHPFFAKRVTKAPAAASSGSSSSASQRAPSAPAAPAPWPTAATTHVGRAGPSASVEYALPPGWAWRPRRRGEGAGAARAPPFPYTAREDAPCTPVPRAPLTDESAAHVRAGIGEQVPSAVAGLCGAARAAPADMLPWNERWRPQSAAQVLSNEDAAAYLRDWLADLRVTYSTRKRQVRTRMPQRKRGRPRIVDDDAMDDYDSDEDAWFEQFRDAASREAYARRQPAEELTNCILLVGPSGCGKSAAVHACAAELGYGVFEIFPGWGRRTGRDINTAIAQLTRNHMVGEAGELASPRQSLILLDEVDVLFDDDAGFWTGVIELIGASQRPVVLTCADASLVPTASLPLQRQLEFGPPRIDDAAAYLSLVALHEGHAVPRTTAAALYHDTRMCGDAFGTSVARTSGPEHPATHAYPVECRAADGAGAPDLRAALVRLQWECLLPMPAEPQRRAADPVLDAPAGMPPALAPLHMLRRAADAMSRSDAAGREPCSGDVLPPWSRAAVSDVPPSSAPPSGAIHDALVLGAGRMYAGAGVLGERLGGVRATALQPRALLALAAQMDAARVAHARHTAQLLALLNVYASEQLPRPAAVLEYAPYVRLILLIDELRIHIRMQQLQHASGGARVTRNSARLLLDTWGARGLEHERRLPFGPDEIRAARATTFPK